MATRGGLCENLGWDGGVGASGGEKAPESLRAER